jgi:Uri superfamily endonuclease
MTGDESPKGTYTLLIEVERAADIGIGALGDYPLPKGWYAYTGSAFGPGGFSRVARHERVARGDHDVRYWHIDYLLGHPRTGLDRAVRTPGADIECPVARALSAGPVPGFGASDCDCRSHLAHDSERSSLLEAIETAHTGALASVTQSTDEGRKR